MITGVSGSPHRPSQTLMSPMMRMLLPLAVVFLGIVAPTGAHYNMLLPDKHSVKKGDDVTITYQWGHPFEHQLFDAPKPEHVWLFAPDGKSKDLVASLEAINVAADEGKKVVAYQLTFKPEQRGDYTLRLKTPPIWLEADEEFVEDVVSVVIHVQAEKGWDREEVTGSVAIRPLTRPYGLAPGSVFQVEVFSQLLRVGEKKSERATVEIERYNATTPKEHPPEEQITRTVKTGPGGVATSTLTDPGWWAITARLDKATTTRERNGKQYPVNDRATFWVPVDEKR
jgi:cobalt/nickel transport protein